MSNDQANCDHIVVMHHFYDMLVTISEMPEFENGYESDGDNVTRFNYCPMCGVKLDVRWK